MPAKRGNVPKPSEKKKRRKSSRYLGVQKIAEHCWQAYAYLKNALGGPPARIHLGRFARERDAAIARDRFVLGALGKHARLNLPSSAKLGPATHREILDWGKRLRMQTSSSQQGTRFVGVKKRNSAGKYLWQARLFVNGQKLRLGDWASEEEAAIARDRAALHYLGREAYLNLPERADELVPADAAALQAEIRKRRKRDSTSRYLGVVRLGPTRGWTAIVKARGKSFCVGTFDDEKEAAKERDRACLALLGKNARLNFHPVTGREVHGRRASDLGLEPALVRKRKFVRKPRVCKATGKVGSSGYRGVHATPEGKFAASVQDQGRGVRAGTWSSAEEAALARDRAILHLGLECPLNLPDRAKKLGPASPLELRKQAQLTRKRSQGAIPYMGVSRATEGLSGYVARIGYRGRPHTLGRFRRCD